VKDKLTFNSNRLSISSHTVSGRSNSPTAALVCSGSLSPSSLLFSACPSFGRLNLAWGRKFQLLDRKEWATANPTLARGNNDLYKASFYNQLTWRSLPGVAAAGQLTFRQFALTGQRKIPKKHATFRQPPASYYQLTNLLDSMAEPADPGDYDC
jgi:hypothetical protein